MPSRRFVVVLAVAVAVLVAACSAPPGGNRMDARHRQVRVGSVRVSVPDPGVTVWAETLRADGRGTVVGVEARTDGRVVIHRPSARDAEQATADVCDDPAYLLFPASWDESYRWRFKATSIPGTLGKDQAVAALKRAAGNIVGADNDCDEPDQVDASHTYLGGTSKGPNISALSACGDRDGVSVVAFGDLASTDLGMTCWWSVDGQTVEADIKLNRVEFAWAVALPKPCAAVWSVEAVATHEFGHAFGLDHVSEAKHPLLTMSPLIAPCQRAETTLGHGDILGLEASY